MICLRGNIKLARISDRRKFKKHNRSGWLTHTSDTKPQTGYFSSNMSNPESPDLLFDVLWFTGINFKLTEKKTVCEKILRNSVCFLYLTGLVYSLGIRLRAFVVDDRGTMIITEMLALVCCILLWISLNVQSRKIVSVHVTISKNRIEDLFNVCSVFPNKFKKSKWMQVVAIITICSPLFSSAAAMLISKSSGENVDKHLNFLALGFKFKVGMYYKYILLFVLRSYDLSICFVSSQMTCFLFSTLSYNVSLCVKETTDQLISNVNDIDVFYTTGKAIKSYRRIQNIILGLETAISLPLFYIMAFLLCELFALMSNAIHLARYGTSFSTMCIVLCAILITGFHAIVLIFCTSSIEENYRSMVRAFVCLPDDTLKPSYVRELLQMLKLLAFNDNVQLTAWGMFPIRRGFFLTIVGTLATYGVLLVQFT
ncbi:hypothetical protein JTE90_008591 [Oedothorax gibbosus]|uniref:Gustatory receptor n=1 Tax=Oedothorax gibbosus TaxID=931172 RepID=A0AAV6UB01_9ARAC|nr:hypothetical protein JTE90_008591 [Oedothorax gibbosus]